jgi:hypothetical protein
MNPKCIFKPQVAPASPPASYDPDRATTKTHGRPHQHNDNYCPKPQFLITTANSLEIVVTP